MEFASKKEKHTLSFINLIIAKEKYMKKIILISLVLNIIGCFGNSYEPIINTVKITSSTGENLYLKSKNWGLTYDHQLTVISMSSVQTWTEPDSMKEYVYKWLEPFLYEFKNDTLFIYCNTKAPTPNSFTSNIKVIQKEVDNYSDLIYKVNNGLGNLKKIPERPTLIPT